jgi:translation initiation factor IF-2
LYARQEEEAAAAGGGGAGADVVSGGGPQEVGGGRGVEARRMGGAERVDPEELLKSLGGKSGAGIAAMMEQMGLAAPGGMPPPPRVTMGSGTVGQRPRSAGPGAVARRPGGGGGGGGGGRVKRTAAAAKPQVSARGGKARGVRRVGGTSR